MTLAMMPLARTPMDQKSASSISSYERKISQMLDNMTPWKSKASKASRMYGLVDPEMRAKVGSGNVVVFLDAGEKADPELFDAATVKKHG